MRTLINSGRFAFVNGGWAASDEACPLYSDIIENILYGHEFLRKEFNISTDIAWHADAFGHSAEVAKLFREMDYKAFFMGRVSDEQKTLL